MREGCSEEEMSELAWEEAAHLEGKGREEHCGRHEGLDLWESEWGDRQRENSMAAV